MCLCDMNAIAGEKGTAYTLITNKDKEFAGHLVRHLEAANQTVPSELMELAQQVCAVCRSDIERWLSCCDEQYCKLQYCDQLIESLVQEVSIQAGISSQT